MHKTKKTKLKYHKTNAISERLNVQGLSFLCNVNTNEMVMVMWSAYQKFDSWEALSSNLDFV